MGHTVSSKALTIDWSGNTKLKEYEQLGQLEKNLSNLSRVIYEKFNRTAKETECSSWRFAASRILDACFYSTLTYGGVQSCSDVWNLHQVTSAFAPALGFGALKLLKEYFFPEKFYAQDVTQANIQQNWKRLAGNFKDLKTNEMKLDIASLKVAQKEFPEAFKRVYNSLFTQRSFDLVLEDYRKIIEPYRVHNEFKSFKKDPREEEEARIIKRLDKLPKFFDTTNETLAMEIGQYKSKVQKDIDFYKNKKEDYDEKLG